MADYTSTFIYIPSIYLTICTYSLTMYLLYLPFQNISFCSPPGGIRSNIDPRPRRTYNCLWCGDFQASTQCRVIISTHQPLIHEHYINYQSPTCITDTWPQYLSEANILPWSALPVLEMRGEESSAYVGRRGLTHGYWGVVQRLILVFTNVSINIFGLQRCLAEVSPSYPY